MVEELEIRTADRPIRARIRPPGSKSITNRALVCAALAEGTSTLRGSLVSEDTAMMIDGLRGLGIVIDSHDGGQTLKIQGTEGQIPAIEAELFVGNSGTTIRFLTALASLGHGSFRLDGVERMRQRPIGDLIEALEQLGVKAQSELGNGCPPVVVHANGLAGGSARLKGDVSSQFLSGLLMAAPCARSNVEVHLDGPLVSQPYVRMTLAVMKSFGIDVTTNDSFDQFTIPAPRFYKACSFLVEPDASAASYFWAAAAITGGEVTVEGLTRQSLQGDVAFVDCLEAMGCEVRDEAEAITVHGKPLRGAELNMNGISDTVQTLAAVALMAERPTTITGVGHIRHKETDRIGNLAKELRKLGATVQEHDDGLTIQPGPLRAASVETYDDHRMAMSLALVGLAVPGVRIRNPGCSAKTYPGFFRDLDSIHPAKRERGRKTPGTQESGS